MMDTPASSGAAVPTHDVAVLCTQGALGEWFTVIPRSSSRARDLQRRGVAAGSSLTSADLRRQLERIGLPRADIDRAVESARRSATTISVQRSTSSLLRLFLG
jgi:hypothetical protein